MRGSLKIFSLSQYLLFIFSSSNKKRTAIYPLMFASKCNRACYAYKMVYIKLWKEHRKYSIQSPILVHEISICLWYLVVNNLSDIIIHFIWSKGLWCQFCFVSLIFWKVWYRENKPICYVLIIFSSLSKHAMFF